MPGDPPAKHRCPDGELAESDCAEEEQCHLRTMVVPVPNMSSGTTAQPPRLCGSPIVGRTRTPVARRASHARHRERIKTGPD
jgi:uncharacterized paraquat-inducible protein A